MLKILLCNDDGIHAPGLRCLWQALKEANFADLTVIAPLSERSGSGVSISCDRPLLIQQHHHDWPDTQAWSVDGTPADCIKMGAKVILETPPDLIVSGINAGSNAGRNVLHSGTVGAVIEGLMRGIPGIAFSSENSNEPHYDIVQQFVMPMVRYVLDHPLPPGSFLNVNFPHAPIQGFRLTRQGVGRWAEDPEIHFKNETGTSFWLGGKSDEKHEHYESDIALLKRGYITAVPIHVHELTDHSELTKRQESFDLFFQQNVEENL